MFVSPSLPSFIYLFICLFVYLFIPFSLCRAAVGWENRWRNTETKKTNRMNKDKGAEEGEREKHLLKKGEKGSTKYRNCT
jgi:hypothetical protein